MVFIVFMYVLTINIFVCLFVLFFVYCFWYFRKLNQVLIRYTVSISGWTYCLNSSLKDRFFEKLFKQFLFTFLVFVRNLLRKILQINIFFTRIFCFLWVPYRALVRLLAWGTWVQFPPESFGLWHYTDHMIEVTQLVHN